MITGIIIGVIIIALFLLCPAMERTALKVENTAELIKRLRKHFDMDAETYTDMDVLLITRDTFGRALIELQVSLHAWRKEVWPWH